jgi:fatty acid/phospholipid biosynthesis enzyme
MTAKRAGKGEDSSMEFLIEELKKKREEAKAAAANAAAAAAAAKTNVKAEEQTAEANVSKID